MNYFDLLPDEITVYIFGLCNPIYRNVIKFVSKCWNEILYSYFPKEIPSLEGMIQCDDAAVLKWVLKHVNCMDYDKLYAYSIHYNSIACQKILSEMKVITGALTSTYRYLDANIMYDLEKKLHIAMMNDRVDLVSQIMISLPMTKSLIHLIQNLIYQCIKYGCHQILKYFVKEDYTYICDGLEGIHRAKDWIQTIELFNTQDEPIRSLRLSEPQFIIPIASFADNTLTDKLLKLSRNHRSILDGLLISGNLDAIQYFCHKCDVTRFSTVSSSIHYDMVNDHFVNGVKWLIEHYQVPHKYYLSLLYVINNCAIINDIENAKWFIEQARIQNINPMRFIYLNANLNSIEAFINDNTLLIHFKYSQLITRHLQYLLYRFGLCFELKWTIEYLVSDIVKCHGSQTNLNEEIYATLKRSITKQGLIQLERDIQNEITWPIFPGFEMIILLKQIYHMCKQHIIYFTFQDGQKLYYYFLDDPEVVAIWIRIFSLYQITF